MSSFIAYYRPRGIVGNYAVGIFLDLAKTETAKVTVSRRRCPNCKHCGIQNPDSVTQIFDVNQPQERILEIYRLDGILFGDSITIEIRDRNVIPYQAVVFEASTKKPEFVTESAFSRVASSISPSAPYVSPHSSPPPKDLKDDRIEKCPKRFVLDGIDYGFATLNEIQLIDWDKQMFEDDVENKRVEDVLFRFN